MEKPTCDRSKYFEALKLMQKYQVGDKYFLIRENKIEEGHIYKVSAVVRNQWSAPKIEIALEFTIELVIRGSVIRAHRTELFKTKEEAAEQFLKQNDVPSELLKVLSQEKPKTTVADLIERLHQIDPETDLEDKFQDIINSVVTRYLSHD